MYLDKAKDQYVVVVPDNATQSFSQAEAAQLNVNFRIEKRAIDLATITKIEAALESGRTKVTSHSFGFGFDPALGVITLTADGPESDFASVEKAFPGK